MSVRRNVSASLGPEPHAVIGRMPASGRYGDFSEIARAALRLLDARERGFEAHRLARSDAPAREGAARA